MKSRTLDWLVQIAVIAEVAVGMAGMGIAMASDLASGFDPRLYEIGTLTAFGGIAALGGTLLLVMILDGPSHG